MNYSSGVAKFQEAIKVRKLSVGMNWNGWKLSGICGNSGELTGISWNLQVAKTPCIPVSADQTECLPCAAPFR